jgi:small subunit ribosomal protein S8
MSVTDPVADMLTRIRNAIMVRHNTVLIPQSKLKQAVAQVLLDEGYIRRFEVVRDGRFPALKIYLKYAEDKAPVLQGIERISKPGCRIYVKKDNIPWVRSGLGTVILSTPRGVVSGRSAREMGVGGEVLCQVW